MNSLPFLTAIQSMMLFHSFQSAQQGQDEAQCLPEGQVRFPTSCNSEIQRFSCTLFVQWKYDESLDGIRFTMKSNYLFNKWVFLAFNMNRTLVRSDAIVMLIMGFGRNVTIKDGWLPSSNEVEFDKQSNLEMFSWSFDRDVVTAEIFRNRFSPDNQDVTFTRSNCYYFIIEFGNLHPLTSLPVVLNVETSYSDRRICIDPCPDEGEVNDTDTMVSFLSGISLVEATYNIALSTKGSRRFNELKVMAERGLTLAYSGIQDNEVYNIAIEVIGFQTGSVLVVYRYEANHDSGRRNSDIKRSLIDGLKDYVANESGRLFGLPYTVEVVEFPEGFNPLQDDSSDNASHARWFFVIVIAIIALYYFAIVSCKQEESIKEKKDFQEKKTFSSLTRKKVYNDCDINTLTQEINEVTQQHIKRASTRSNSVNTSSKNSSPRSSLKHNLEALSKHTGEKKLFKKIPSLLRLKRNSNDSDDQSEEESSKAGSRKGSDDQENNQEKNAFYKYTKQILKLKKKESDSDTNYVTAFSTLDTYSDP